MKEISNTLIYPLAIIGVLLLFFYASKTNAQYYNISFEPDGGSVTTIKSVLVENLNQGTNLTLPGSNVLLLGDDGNYRLREYTETVKVYPNPMQGIAELSFYAHETGYMQLIIYNINGKVVVESGEIIEKGINSYLVKDLTVGMYVINIIGSNYNYTTKVVSQLNTESKAKLTFNGLGNPNTGHSYSSPGECITAMAYKTGDILRFTAYSGDYISQITDIPTSSKTIVFEFTGTTGGEMRAWTCGSPFRVYHVADSVDPVNKMVNYATVTGIPGEPTKCWITSNLGADYQAGGINDASEQAAGWYWQFNGKRGFKHDGHYRTPNITWITNINDSSNWRPDNDPCRIDLPKGWRIPTMTEWSNVEHLWSDPWNSGLYLHHAGLLGAGNGYLYNRGNSGLYWSSEQEDANHDLYLDFDWGPDVYKNKTYGYPLRCIMENCMTSEAGPDQKVCDTATLAGNDPYPGSGLWTEVSGTSGYYFTNPNEHDSKFTGLAQTTYILRWTIYPDNCDFSYDDVNIGIIGNVTISNICDTTYNEGIITFPDPAFTIGMK